MHEIKLPQWGNQLQPAPPDERLCNKMLPFTVAWSAFNEGERVCEGPLIESSPKGCTRDNPSCAAQM
jgi:hypothetical protein